MKNEACLHFRHHFNQVVFRHPACKKCFSAEEGSEEHGYEKYGSLLPPIMLPVSFVTPDQRITRRNNAEKKSKKVFRKKIGRGGRGRKQQGTEGR
jgi:hypothetical protein